MNKKPKILIVDDRPENLVALETVLRDLDVELIKANSGNEALKATLYHDFALALLDVQMPEMDGYELAGILREEEKTSRLPFIFISAVYTDNPNIFKGYERGAFSFITKPFQPEILINKVKFFIKIHQQELALSRLNEDLKNTNTNLILMNKELESFSYSVSHDLRAPLRAVHGYAKMLSEDYSKQLDGEANRLINNIMSNGKKMGQLIDDLLEFSRVGRKELNKTNVSMHQMVTNFWDELKNECDYRNIEFEIKELHSVKSDSVAIKQVWVNLILNAVKYTKFKAPAVIEIGSEVVNDEIVFYVKDNGAGFDMRYADKLFGVFQRLHSDDEFEGTGVGLAIVKRIVSRHGGRVWAESRLNEGATFYFSLPKI
jgi:signal transduction histidine kinase